jgi:GntR family transcriptional repressor for pyruvate dehydrogenase complex
MHRKIYRAIRARDPIEARKLMEQHLRMAQTAQGMERRSARKSTNAGVSANNHNANPGSSRPDHRGRLLNP